MGSSLVDTLSTFTDPLGLGAGGGLAGVLFDPFKTFLGEEEEEDDEWWRDKGPREGLQERRDAGVQMTTGPGFQPIKNSNNKQIQMANALRGYNNN